MMEAINSAIAIQLEPLIDRISELEDSGEDKDRRNRGGIRMGKVSQHSECKQLIKVKFGENETPFIQWFAVYCGDVAEYRLPSIGEKALLLNYGGGDSSAMSIALVGIPSAKFPLPSNNPDLTVRVYPDGTSVTYDHQAHHLTVSIAGGEATLIAPKQITCDTKLLHVTGDIKSDGDITDKKRSMAADRVIYNGHKHNHGNPTTSIPNSKQ